MAGQITRAFGEKLFLQAQLYDQEASLPKRVIADLMDSSGAIIGTSELAHTVKGVFVEETETMPNEPVIMAKFYVYETDGVTVDDNFGISEDRYMLSENSCTSGIITIGESLSGEIQDDTILGNISDESINGEINEENAIIGTIQIECIQQGVISDC